MDPKIAVMDDGLLIDWPDGHQTRYAFEELRRSCPCADCRGPEHQEGRLRSHGGNSEQSNRIVRITPVGRYAIQIVWGDGHSTGIYPWDYLRRQCGCFACRETVEREAQR
ncbi:MAG: DUF971 domain-containing protein [Candidatus Eisenbacteria bacterium]|nr:DUF971 domain-containing protein [Candidatus Eisenbacteria bacterium]